MVAVETQRDDTPPYRMTTTALLAGIRAGNVTDLARAISLVENARDGYEALLSAIHPAVGRAHRVGVTGPPGAGKSTLTDRLITAYRARGVSVAVVAVDPTSPFTGGALLGDRIRMESMPLDAGVFIRSMATRGSTGGLATTTREVCDVLDAFGFDRIIIETVGVGQSELAIAASADTAMLVLVPESGDGVQVLKAGIMEIADLFVVNKADRPGAERLKQEIEVMLGLRRGNAFRHVAPHHHRAARGGDPPSRSPARMAPDAVPGGVAAWEPPAYLAAASQGQGIPEIVDAIERHAGYLASSGELQRRRRARLERLTREVVDRTLHRWVWQGGAADARLAAGMEDVLAGTRSPYELAREIFTALTKGSDHGT